MNYTSRRTSLWSNLGRIWRRKWRSYRGICLLRLVRIRLWVGGWKRCRRLTRSCKRLWESRISRSLGKRRKWRCSLTRQTLRETREQRWAWPSWHRTSILRLKRTVTTPSYGKQWELTHLPIDQTTAVTKSFAYQDSFRTNPPLATIRPPNSNQCSKPQPGNSLPPLRNSNLLSAKRCRLSARGVFPLLKALWKASNGTIWQWRSWRRGFRRSQGVCRGTSFRRHRRNWELMGGRCIVFSWEIDY